MTGDIPSYLELEERIRSWANTRPDIRSAVVVGSHARQDHPAGEWSDLDLILFTADLSRYIQDTSWQAEIGEVWLAVDGSTGHGDPEWMVIFQGGYKVDFVFTLISKELPPTASLELILATSPYAFVYARGVRPLVASPTPAYLCGEFTFELVSCGPPAYSRKIPATCEAFLSRCFPHDPISAAPRTVACKTVL